MAAVEIDIQYVRNRRDRSRFPTGTVIAWKLSGSYWSAADRGEGTDPGENVLAVATLTIDDTRLPALSHRRLAVNNLDAPTALLPGTDRSVWIGPMDGESDDPATWSA